MKFLVKSNACLFKNKLYYIQQRFSKAHCKCAGDQEQRRTEYTHKSFKIQLASNSNEQANSVQHITLWSQEKYGWEEWEFAGETRASEYTTYTCMSRLSYTRHFIHELQNKNQRNNWMWPFELGVIKTTRQKNKTNGKSHENRREQSESF